MVALNKKESVVDISKLHLRSKEEVKKISLEKGVDYSAMEEHYFIVQCEGIAGKEGKSNMFHDFLFVDRQGKQPHPDLFLAVISGKEVKTS
mmetsp:Transcript_23081/g.17501  ORF Transcript_23081/g.17501 Transcript_23081/m.17501 type:complete len:91 (-) Transcript_23081:6-278(-)